LVGYNSSAGSMLLLGVIKQHGVLGTLAQVD